MFNTIKKTIKEIVNQQGYEIADNGFRRDQFPVLMLRLSNQTEAHTKDLSFEVFDFIIDVFSTYSGEKEINDIKEKITSPILDTCNALPNVMSSALRTYKILDDNSTGPVRKHGVLSYRFVVTRVLGE